MEALIKEICLKTGINETQARDAVNIVAQNLKVKMPHVFHSQIDNLINGGSLSDGVKNKFRDLSDDAEDAVKNFGSKAEEFAGDVKKKFEEVFKKSNS